MISFIIKCIQVISITFIFTISISAENLIIIDKPTLQLYVVNESNDTILTVPVCIGRNLGNKMCNGDMRTPEGNFRIIQIQNSSKWTHNFHDGKGERKEAYGPWFLRLNTYPYLSIGIHGTCFPESVPSRNSEGCIRLLNSDINKLYNLVRVGTEVIITPDK